MGDTGESQSNEERIVELELKNQELEAQLAASKEHRGWRMYLAMVVVVLFAIVLAAANVSAWFATTALDTDRFVDTFAPLPEDPAVAAALGQEFAARVVENTDIQGEIEGFLPEGISFIAVPLTTAIEDLIANTASSIVSSNVFTTIWEGALRVTHSAVIVVLEGGPGDNLVAEDGTIAVDLSGLVEQVDEALSERGIDILDAGSVDATIDLYSSENLRVAQAVAELIYQVRWGVLIGALVLLIAAVLIATDKRRVTVWLGLAAVIAMAVDLIILRLMRGTTVSDIADPVLREGAEAAWSIVVDRLVAQTVGVLLLGAVVALLAWMVGPSERAVGLRTRFAASRDERRGDTADGGWLADNLRVVQWIVVALGVVFLLLVPNISGLIVLVAALVVIGAIVGLEWFYGGQQREPAA